MLSFKEYLFLEAFDLNQTSYTISPSKRDLLQDIYPEYPNMMAWDFKVANNEYVVYKFTKNNATEFHFSDWTNENDNNKNDVPMAEASKVFSTVMKIAYDLKSKAFMNQVRITFKEDRKQIYDSIFKYASKKWFPEYNKSETHFYETITDGIVEDRVYAFDLSKHNLPKTGVSVNEIKDRTYR